MRKTWSRIETWLGENAPEILQSLQPGASAAELRKAEKELGLTLPQDVKESYGLHDGQRPLATPLMGEWELLSLKNVLRQWNAQQKLLKDGVFGTARGEPVGPVRPDWYNAKWVPFAYNGGGDLYCLDYDPPPGGRQGQVVTFWHVDDKRERLAESFGALLEAFAEDLEAGRYRLEDGVLVRQAGPSGARAKAGAKKAPARGKAATKKAPARGKAAAKKAPAKKKTAAKKGRASGARTPARRR